MNISLQSDKFINDVPDKPFSIRANHFSRAFLFCIFVTNTIYVIKIEMLEPVVLARKHKFGKPPILMLDCMISKVSCGL